MNGRTAAAEITKTFEHGHVAQRRARFLSNEDETSWLNTGSCKRLQNVDGTTGEGDLVWAAGFHARAGHCPELLVEIDF